MNILERIKRLWAPARPDYPLTEAERDQLAANRYDGTAEAAATILSHGDPNITGGSGSFPKIPGESGS